MITDEQWNKYLEKYGRLMWMIAGRISGDTMTASLEDNYSDLCIAAMDSIVGFEKTNPDYGNFDSYIDTKRFDAYTKSILWHAKNKKGSNLTKKMNFRKSNMSIHAMLEDETFDIEDKRSDFTGGLAMMDMFLDLDPESKLVLDTIASDPNVLTQSGKLKVYSLIKPTGLTIHSVNRAINKIKKILSINCVEKP